MTDEIIDFYVITKSHNEVHFKFEKLVKTLH